MIIRCLLFLSLFSLTSRINAHNSFKLSWEEVRVIVEFQDQQLLLEQDTIVTNKVKFKRGKAIIFTVLTGLLGGHRIYFGTKPRTPILYSVTLGGLGILPFIDLIHIIFTKDLSVYEHKSQVIMWRK